MENIKTALKTLGCKGRAQITEEMNGRYLVNLNGEYFGIWDAEKKTFVD